MRVAIIWEICGVVPDVVESESQTYERALGAGDPDRDAFYDTIVYPALYSTNTTAVGGPQWDKVGSVLTQARARAVAACSLGHKTLGTGKAEYLTAYQVFTANVYNSTPKTPDRRTYVCGDPWTPLHSHSRSKVLL